MSVLDAVLAFSRERPLWLQDALRRLAARNALTETDYRELLAAAKTDSGIATAEPPTLEVLAEVHLSADPAATQRVLLNSLGDVKYANRLAAGQTLPFIVDGVTVIYGDNGSGKSGYCRLLKKLCRVCEGADEAILPDAFKPAPPGPAEVKVRFTVGDGDPSEILWRDRTSPPPALRQLSVFDSRAAPLYVNRDNRIEYLPFGLDLLTRLGGVCQELASRLDRDIQATERACSTAISGFQPDTEAGLAVARLQLHTPAQSLPTATQLRELGSWTPAHARRLAELAQELDQDATALAVLLDRAAEAATALAAMVNAALPRLGDAGVGTLRTSVARVGEARRAVELAASTAFGGEPLQRAGSEPWRLMFEHARRYSVLAYPGQAFPVTGPGARCVLCHQELDSAAARRFQRFDDFVRGAAEEHARHCEADLQLVVDDTRGLATADPAGQSNGLHGFPGADEQLRQDAIDMLAALGVRQLAALAFASGQTATLDVQPLPTNPSRRLADAAAAHRARAIELRASAGDPGVRATRLRDRNNLADRQSLAGQIDTVLARQADLESVHKLRTCRASCDTNAISRKGTELRREFVTEAFAQEILQEAKTLGVDYIPLRVTDRSERGASLVGVSVNGLREVKNDAVLSEGERKALSLACFLAEVGRDPRQSGIVFDDPVSSLDHRHRRRVAQRLVAEARSKREARPGRQVIVFTHDIVFLNELKNAATTQGVPLAIHTVQWTSSHGFGTVSRDEEPWISKNTGARIAALQQRLAEARRLAVAGGDGYALAVKDFYTALRQTWERLVEADLLGGVVTRFQSEVKTQTLREVAVEDDDHRAIFLGMKRASEWSGHDQAEAAQLEMPSPEDMANDLEALVQLRGVVDRRRRDTKARRERVERPPQGTLG